MEFERKFVEVVADLVRKSRMSAKDFSSLAFPSQAKPDNKWQRIRLAAEEGRAQKVTIEDAYRIASTLGHDLAALMWLVSKELDARGGKFAPGSAKRLQEKKILNST